MSAKSVLHIKQLQITKIGIGRCVAKIGHRETQGTKKYNLIWEGVVQWTAYSLTILSCQFFFFFFFFFKKTPRHFLQYYHIYP